MPQSDPDKAPVLGHDKAKVI